MIGVAARVLAALILATLAVSWFSPVAASAPRDPRALPPPFVSSVGEPELDDPTVAWLARDQDISAADAARRFAWQLRAEQLTEWAVWALGSRFGGIWIDDEDHGRLKVGVVAATAQDRRQLDAQGFTGAADIVDVPRSLAELETAADWLWSRALPLNHEAVEHGRRWTLAVGMSPSRSTANLYVPSDPHRSDQQRHFIEMASATLGSALHVEPYEEPHDTDACNTTLPPYCDPPLRAGIAINHGTTPCTGGFPARSRSDDKLYQFTAGHCTRNRTNNWTTRFPSGSEHAIGPVHNCEAGRGASSNCRQGGGDYAILRVNNPSGWQQGRGWVFVRASGSNDGVAGTTRDEQYPIRRTSTLPTNWEGMRICKSGRSATATSCGRVIDVGRGYTDSAGYSYTGLAITTYCRLSGDSGAPVYASNTAYGIHQGGAGNMCRAYYQGITAAQNGMNVDVVLAP